MSPLSALRPSVLRRRTTVLVAGLAAGAAVLSGCSVYDAPLPGGPDVGDQPIKVTAMFRDVLDLVPQSTVKVDDVTVGKVTKVSLKGYTARITMELPKDVDLPDNATAQIRQTSLLGEKFVSLAPPSDPSKEKLGNGDVIGLDRTGRNPEVEEVFSALALLLNGGGVGQLKSITEEINTALGGRESDVRSVLEQIRLFVGQLDDNKSSVVAALENTNRLAAELRKQDGTIKATLDDVPAALRSVNGQRRDLVKLLQSLNRLSGVGVRVIQASKESTINSLRDLAPVLDKFAEAGQSFPKSLQVFLTYPFVDEAVGRDPQVARNLHQGDYTNLSVNLDLDVADLKLPGLPGLPSPVCDALSVLQDRANAAAKQVVDAIPSNAATDLILTPDYKKKLEKDIADKLVAEFKGQCKAPNPTKLASTAGDILKTLLALPRYDALQQALNNLPGGVGGVVGGIVGGVTGGLTGGLTGGGTGGGLLPRAQLGQGYQVAQPIDPFGLARRGLDPGIGTMLLQGVADVR